MTQLELEIRRKCFTVAADVFLSDLAGHNGFSVLTAFEDSGSSEMFPEEVVVWTPFQTMEHSEIAEEIRMLGDRMHDLVMNEIMQAEHRVRDQVLAQMREAADAYRAMGGAKEEAGGDGDA